MNRLRKWLAPPHPTYISKRSKDRVRQFLQEEQTRTPEGLRLNLGSGNKCYEANIFNLDLFPDKAIDIQGDLLNLPIKNESVETIVCTGVLEHVSDSVKAAKEIFNVLKSGGMVYLETPFMQTVHAVPNDFSRWTPEGLRELLRNFDVDQIKIVAGPASGLAWQFQETMAMLFSFGNDFMYKVGLRLFGWFAVPLSWLDILLEKNPMAWRAASGFAVIAQKKGKI
jgi:SAM-dependent methyltransferase